LHAVCLIIIATFCLAGCAVGPDFEPPAPPQTQSYTETGLPVKTAATNGPGGDAQYFVRGKDVSADWWHLFRSAPLDDLVKRGIKKNPTLSAAQASLRQAAENLNVSTASLFPVIDAGSFAERQRINGAFLGNPSLSPPPFTLYNASVNVSYPLDVFGGIRRGIEASEADVESAAFEVEATLLTLTANIVTAAMTDARLRAQIQTTEDVIALQEKVLAITQQRLQSGGASRLDVLAQTTQLVQTRATLAPLQANLAKTRHALSVLIGELPSESKLPAFRLADMCLPLELPISLPSTLVQQRPDVRASEARLHAASAQIGVETANLLPKITLSGSYGGSSNKLKDLFDSSSVIWNLVGQALQPIFHGGALVAKRDAAMAAFEKAYAQYRQTVLQAFQNVADALRVLEFDAQQLQVQTEAEGAAQKTFALTQTQYKAGAVSYVNLLEAEKQYHQARIGRIQAQAARYTDTAALFQALGGGWWNRK